MESDSTKTTKSASTSNKATAVPRPCESRKALQARAAAKKVKNLKRAKKAATKSSLTTKKTTATKTKSALILFISYFYIFFSAIITPMVLYPHHCTCRARSEERRV